MDEGHSASYVSGLFKVSLASLFNSFQRLKEEDINRLKEEAGMPVPWICLMGRRIMNADPETPTELRRRGLKY